MTRLLLLDNEDSNFFFLCFRTDQRTSSTFISCFSSLSIFSLAVLYGDEDIVRLLCELGSDVHTADAYGRTLLHIAARYNHVSLIRFLCEQGCAVDAFVRSLSLSTPLYMIFRLCHHLMYPFFHSSFFFWKISSSFSFLWIDSMFRILSIELPCMKQWILPMKMLSVLSVILEHTQICIRSPLELF